MFVSLNLSKRVWVLSPPRVYSGMPLCSLAMVLKFRPDLRTKPFEYFFLHPFVQLGATKDINQFILSLYFFF